MEKKKKALEKLNKAIEDAGNIGISGVFMFASTDNKTVSSLCGRCGEIDDIIRLVPQALNSNKEFSDMLTLLLIESKTYKSHENIQ